MNEEDTYFDLPKDKSNVIKVIGVGGGGSNAVNYMYDQGFKGVDFVVCNTDSQPLRSSKVPNKIQLGVALTKGLGAGANPLMGAKAAEESLEELEVMLDTETKMVFITAGMGGGTGTGAAPVIAKLAKNKGILVVGIVTMPFSFEGPKRDKQARNGVDELKKYVDSIIIVNNSKLVEMYGKLGWTEGFFKADEVLAAAARGVSEIITTEYVLNIDLNDVNNVLQDSGTAIMGTGRAQGDNRAIKAINNSLNSPLLNDSNIFGAKSVLLLIKSSDEKYIATIDEIDEINNYIQAQAGHTADIIFGLGIDKDLGEYISTTIVATGFSQEKQNIQLDKVPEKIVHSLNGGVEVRKDSYKANDKNVKPEKKIVHNLEDYNDQPIEEVSSNDFNVVDDSEEEFIIIDQEDEKYEDDKYSSNEQTTIEFDLPLGEVSVDVADEIHDLDVAVDLEMSTKKEVIVEVQDVVVEPTVELTKDVFDSGVKIATDSGEKEVDFVPEIISKRTDALIEVESQGTRAKDIKIENKEIEIIGVIDKEDVDDPSILFTTKTLSTDKSNTRPQVGLVKSYEGVDPTEIPLDQVRKMDSQTKERLKRFSYDFNNANTNDDLGREPAFVRAGLDLHNDLDDINKPSRYSVKNGKTDENITINKNNSFLHDNVD